MKFKHPTSRGVGYQKPPIASRFKKGTSGNPNGRPKKPTDLASEVDEVLSEKVTIRINGKPMRVTMRQAILRRLAADAATGKAAAFRELMNIRGGSKTRKELLDEIFPDDFSFTLNIGNPPKGAPGHVPDPDEEDDDDD